MVRTRLAVALVVLMVTSLIVPVAMVGANETDDADCDPELTVTYDEFRTDQPTIDEINSSSGAVHVTRNTRATVQDADAFVRVTLENPNSYCVAFEVEISNEAVTPSTLGTVRPADGDTDATAKWEATHDFDDDETHTKVSVTLPPGSEAMYAPSDARVEMLSWTATGKEHADGIRSLIGDRLGFGTDLETRDHEISGNESEIVTVDLTHPETGDPVDKWHATYEVDDGKETPLGSTSDRPVFYRELENEDGEVTGLQITYNEDADVHLTAEPRMRDSLGYEMTSYRASLRDAFDFNLPFSTMSPDVVGFTEVIAW